MNFFQMNQIKINGSDIQIYDSWMRKAGAVWRNFFYGCLPVSDSTFYKESTLCGSELQDNWFWTTHISYGLAKMCRKLDIIKRFSLW